MPRKMSAKQIAIFGTKAQKAALRRRRSGGSHSTPRRTKRRVGVSKRSTMARRTRRTRKSPGRRTKRGFNIASAAVAGNAIAQMVEPYLSAGVIQAIQAKDVGAFIAAMKAGSKEAVSLANLIEAGGPALALAVIRRLQKAIGFRSPSFGGIRAF